MINAKSIINSAKEALLNIFKKEFKPSEIGVLIVGSAARQDFLKDWSDIDVVLYFNKKDLVFEDLTKIRNVSKSLNANGSHQYWFKVHTSGDFPHLYQKHLIRNYYNDGFQVYGIDVKEVINSKFNVSDEDIISEGKKLAKNHGFSPRFLYRCFITGTHENDPVFESTHIKKEYIINRHANELRIAKIIDMVLDASYFILFKKNIIPSCDKFNYASRFALEFKCLIPFQLLRFREEEWLNGSNSISGERALYAEKLSFEFFEKVYPLLADTER